MRRINVDTPAVDYWHHTRYWSPYRPTVVYVGSIAIGLIIFEYPENATLRYLNGKYVRDTAELERRHSRNSYRSWTTTRELPSGRFRIFAYSPYHGVNLSRTWDETKAASLRPKLKAIAQEIEAMAPKLAQELEKAEREAEIRHQQWLIEEDRRKREEDKRRIRQSEVESDADLRTIIGTWSEVVGVERFLAGVEQRAEHLSPDRWLRVPDEVMAELTALPEIYPRDWSRKPENLRLFGYADRGGPRKLWAKACKAAGIEQIPFHPAGRHGFGQEMNVREKVDEKAAGAFGGWSDLNLMRNTYTHAEDTETKINEALRRGLVKAEIKTKLKLRKEP